MISAKVLNAILFQAGWLACVAGGNAWALPAGALILALPQCLAWLDMLGRDRSRHSC